MYEVSHHVEKSSELFVNLKKYIFYCWKMYLVTVNPIIIYLNKQTTGKSIYVPHSGVSVR